MWLFPVLNLYFFLLADKLYREATEILSELRPKREEGLKLLVKASNLGNLRAKALIAWESLFGVDMLQNITLVKETFTELAAQGIPEAHMVTWMKLIIKRFHILLMNVF